jgi:hypothetical protein
VFLSSALGEEMAKYKSYNYAQMVMIPVSLEKKLMPGTLESAIHELVQRRMDTSIFDRTYHNDTTGCPAYAPKILLKVILLVVISMLCCGPGEVVVANAVLDGTNVMGQLLGAGSRLAHEP